MRLVIDAVENVKPIEGRMELIQTEQQFAVIIDYCQHISNYEAIFEDMLMEFDKGMGELLRF